MEKNYSLNLNTLNNEFSVFFKFVFNIIHIISIKCVEINVYMTQTQLIILSS